MIYKFNPILKSVLWGGEQIKAYKNITSEQTHIGESWEISCVKNSESIVAEGQEKGISLPALIEKHKGALLGDRIYAKFGATFPLLVKIIDAKKNLSVQVHPDDALARERHGCMGKTEMWYIIDTYPDAKIYVGLSQEVSPEQFSTLVDEKEVMHVIAAHDSAPGDVFFLPAGRIHAIGAGNILAEIQETSDITYRIYDFDRRDANGNPRELHVAQALDAIDYKVYPEYKTQYDRCSSEPATLVDCEHFKVSRVIVNGETPLEHSHESFTAIVCVEGECEIIAKGEGKASVTATLRKGHSLLAAACADSLTACGSATLLTARI